MPVYKIVNDTDFEKLINGIKNELVIVNWVDKEDDKSMLDESEINVRNTYVSINTKRFPELVKKYGSNLGDKTVYFNGVKTSI